MQDLDYFCPTKVFKCIEDQAWDVVLRRLERTPQEAQLWIVRRAFDKSIIWRRLPLHEALIHSAPLAVIEALLVAYAGGARDKDSSHRLALHYACQHHASPDLIKVLLKSYPDGAKEKDSSNRIAIHYAYESNATFDVIKQLLIAHPDCLDVEDDLGNTPGEYLDNAISLMSKDDGEESLAHKNKEITASYIVIQILKQALNDNEEQLKKYQNFKTAVDELTLMRMDLESKVETCEQEISVLKESNYELRSGLVLLNDSLSAQAHTLEVSEKNRNELNTKLLEEIARSAENEKRLLDEKTLALAQLKEQNLDELASSQNSYRKMLDDLNEEFSVYKQTRSSQIDSLVAAQSLLMENLKTQESENAFLRDEVEKKIIEIKRYEDLQDKGQRRAETLTNKLKEAVDEIQKATNCILEERQLNAELELEMEIAVNSLEDLETRNQMLEVESTATRGELDLAKQENVKLSDQCKSMQKELSHTLTELENSRSNSDNLQRQIYDVVEKYESAVNILKDQQVVIDKLTSDLKAKEESVMLLEGQICDLKISQHLTREDSMTKEKELQIAKEENEKLSDQIQGIQTDLSHKITELTNSLCHSHELHNVKQENVKLLDQIKVMQSDLLFKTDELENARRHSDDLQRQVYEVVENCENAFKIIKDHQNIINNLNYDLELKDDSIMRLNEHLYELKISHHAVQEDSASLAKTIKLINLCLSSANSNEGGLEELGRNRVSKDRLIMQGQRFIYENKSSIVSSPTNVKDSSLITGDLASKEFGRKIIHQSTPSETSRPVESRYDFDGEYSQFNTHSIRSPPASPRLRNNSLMAQIVGQERTQL